MIILIVICPIESTPREGVEMSGEIFSTHSIIGRGEELSHFDSFSVFQTIWCCFGIAQGTYGKPALVLEPQS
tara:strand:+ start:744 stop:959 length:216 start_codon:yes stop_codon:yes gene_type:complete